MGLNDKKTIFVGLSGGVDSAVVAALLKQQGHEVVGVFMKNWSGDQFGIQADCPWEEDQKMAELVAAHLGIPFRSYNFEKQYRERVMKNFFAEYAAGRTPNPDILCNREIKFDEFWEKAKSEGADLIATGHYARRQTNDSWKQETGNNKHQADDKQGEEGGFLLLKGVDSNKDQTYFLSGISQEQLSHAIFPIGHLTKPEVRKLANELKLPNFNRPDSQGICFVGEIDVRNFLRDHISTKSGDIVDVDTQKVMGKHDGVYYYTIGQREGLGIGGQAEPYFVVGKDVERNILFVGHGNNHPQLLKREVIVEKFTWINEGYALEVINSGQQISGVSRYRQPAQPGQIDLDNNKFTFDEAQRAITPGQSLVLYNGDICLGSGVIV